MQDEKISQVKADLSKKLHKNFENSEPDFYWDGWTGAVVFDLDRKYLIKITNSETIESQVEFLRENPRNIFSNVICYDLEVGYICLEFIEGVKYNEAKLNAKDALWQVSNIVKNYREYPHAEGYGFLRHEFPTWKEFLRDEIDYARGYIPTISTDKVMAALDVIGNKQPKQYLMHGDFGTHNFLVEKSGRIRVIDPMPVVGDYLYDFYFAILSNTNIFTIVGADYIYSFFDRDIEEKKALLTIALYVRMSRAFKYDRENFDAYTKMYANI